MASTIAQRSLDDATAVGNGTTIDFLTAKSFVGSLVIANGTVTGGEVAIQLSQDGTNWVDTAFFSPQTAVHFVYRNPGGAFRFWRARIVSAITGGGSVDVTFMEGN